jgi:hypothetical protein
MIVVVMMGVVVVSNAGGGMWDGIIVYSCHTQIWGMRINARIRQQQRIQRTPPRLSSSATLESLVGSNKKPPAARSAVRVRMKTRENYVQ